MFPNFTFSFLCNVSLIENLKWRIAHFSALTPVGKAVPRGFKKEAKYSLSVLEAEDVARWIISAW